MLELLELFELYELLEWLISLRLLNWLFSLVLLLVASFGESKADLFCTDTDLLSVTNSFKSIWDANFGSVSVSIPLFMSIPATYELLLLLLFLEVVEALVFESVGGVLWVEVLLLVAVLFIEGILWSMRWLICV